MSKFMQFITEQIFPSIRTSNANKKLKKEIESTASLSNYSSMENINTIPLDSFKQRYAETFEIKKNYEDKAKTNVIGITIAITVIMGASGLTGSLISKYSCVALHWLSFAILLVAIVYLLVSGIDAIKVLFDEHSMSIMELPDLATDSPAIKEKYDDCTIRNINRNIIRNNILYSSFICTRNALICMMILFVLVSIPFTTTKYTDTTKVVSNDFLVSYSSTIIIPDNIHVYDVNNSVIQDKEGRECIVDGVVYSFVNLNSNYFVQYKCFESEIIVENFFCFDRTIDQ